MREDVHEQFSAWDKGTANLGREKCIVLHVLEELNGNHTVKRSVLKLEINDIAGDDGQVVEAFRSGNTIDVCFLSAAVGKGSNLRVGKYLSKIK